MNNKLSGTEIDPSTLVVGKEQKETLIMKPEIDISEEGVRVSTENNDVDNCSIAKVGVAQDQTKLQEGEANSSRPPVVAPTVLPQLKFPRSLTHLLDIVQGDDGRSYARIQEEEQNPYLIPVGSKQLNNRIYQIANEEDINLRMSDLRDINNLLNVHAENSSKKVKAWYRNAKIDGGVVIDMGDDEHTHIRITAGKVEVLKEGSSVLFYRTPVMLPMVKLAEEGSLRLINKFFNLHPIETTLLIAAITYTLAHAKIPSTTYLIIALFGGQGTAKSFTTRLIKLIVDPTQVGLQTLPKSEKDLAIAAQNALAIAIDNARQLKLAISDMLCVMASAGTLPSRMLYTDAEQALIRMHAAVIINGIHPFVSQSDLSQRCLPLQLRPIDEKHRKSEAELEKELEADLPYIMRGLFELIAEIFIHLPDVKVTQPERMYDFCKWLAAMEKAQAVPAGIYQQEYSRLLKQGQLDTILDNELAAGVYTFAEEFGDWSGTPSELLKELHARATQGTQRAKSWPGNPIALSKRLVSLQASLATQGVRVELTRGKHRQITIEYSGGNDE